MRILMRKVLTIYYMRMKTCVTLRTFSQWLNTDRANLNTQTLLVDDFIELSVNSTDDMTIHGFISKAQSSYFKDCKGNLQNDSCIVILDFAENNQFIVQDEVQSFKSNNGQCSIHPGALYYRESETNELKEQSFGFISDGLKDDTVFANEVIKKSTQPYQN